MTVPLVLDLDDHGIYVHKWDNTRQGAGSTQSVSSSRIPSVTLDTNAGDTSTPYMRFSSKPMSRVDRPRAYKATMLALNRSKRRVPLGTILGFERGVTVSGHVQVHRADL